MSALELMTLPNPAHTMPRGALERLRAWRARRQMRRIERLAARQLAGLSPHTRSDIGVAAPERDPGASLRFWI
jgi:uncharacterized protein YjiS (DUF1127 family)